RHQNRMTRRRLSAGAGTSDDILMAVMQRFGLFLICIFALAFQPGASIEQIAGAPLKGANLTDVHLPRLRSAGSPLLQYNVIQRGKVIERSVRCVACGYSRPITWKEKRSLLVQVGIAKAGRRRVASRAH